MLLGNKWLNDYIGEHKYQVFKSYQPCPHKGCMHHIITPCELCGRIGAQGDIKIEREQLEKNINRYKKILKINKKLKNEKNNRDSSP